MALNINITGKLIHVFRSSRDGDSETRHSLQLLCEPENGLDNERFTLESYKLPKGTNYQHFMDKTGSVLEVKLAQWKQGERSGFYIQDVKDIQIKKEPAKVKAA